MVSWIRTRRFSGTWLSTQAWRLIRFTSHNIPNSASSWRVTLGYAKKCGRTRAALFGLIAAGIAARIGVTATEIGIVTRSAGPTAGAMATTTVTTAGATVTTIVTS